MKLNKILFGLVAASSLAFTACSDDDIDYKRGSWDATADFADIYFKDATPSVELDPLDPTTVTIELCRRVAHSYTYEKDVDGNDSLVADNIASPLPALTVKFDITENTDDVFTVGEATFAEGDSVATVEINFPDAEVGKPYTLGLNISDPSLVSANYSKDGYCTFTVTRVKWNVVGFYFDEDGNRVDGMAMYTDDIITGAFGVDNLSYPIQVQERDDKPGYFRLVNVYDGKYLYNEPGDWDDSKDYYIYIDATNPAKVFIPHDCEFGVDWGYGMMSVSSIAGLRLAQNNPTAAEGYYGTYANGMITFPKDALLFNYGTGGFYTCNSAGLFSVVIDPTLNPYKADVIEDFDYTKVFDGVLMSGLRGTNTNATLYVGEANNTTDNCDAVFAATYGTPYYVENAYAEGYNLYFAVNGDGEVTIPEGFDLQPTGLDDNAGHDIYAKISTLSTYQENYLKLIVTFQTKDGSLIYGNTEEILANLTYSEVGQGVYTYGVDALSEGGDSFYEGTEQATLYRCDQLPGNYYLKPWAASEEGLQFTVQSDNTIKFYQSTGETFQDYGEVYFIDIEAYNPGYADYLGTYDEKEGLFEFVGIYTIHGVGGFGLIAETFQLNAEQPAAARKVEHRQLNIQPKYKAANRLVGKKVENRRPLKAVQGSVVK